MTSRAEPPSAMTSDINSMNELYYSYSRNTWGNNRWQGVPIYKNAFDLFIYQEIICETQPDIIVECGTACGGSAYYMANIFDLIKKGEIVTVDIEDKVDKKHDRVTYLLGRSVDESIVCEVKKRILDNKKVMVILDSDHSKANVFRELELYSHMVSEGCYLIVEDTNLNGHPVKWSRGEGPMEAIMEFLPKHKEFEIDKSREKLLITFNPSGYLKRLKGGVS